jgi:hypothetical protein
MEGTMGSKPGSGVYFGRLVVGQGGTVSVLTRRVAVLQ